MQQICLKNIHVTKRDLFYPDIKLFRDQLQSDAEFGDVSCMLRCTRLNIKVVTAKKGMVIALLNYSVNGDMIDCTKMGVAAKPFQN